MLRFIQTSWCPPTWIRLIPIVVLTAGFVVYACTKPTEVEPVAQLTLQQAGDAAALDWFNSPASALTNYTFRKVEHSLGVTDIVIWKYGWAPLPFSGEYSTLMAPLFTTDCWKWPARYELVGWDDDCGKPFGCPVFRLVMGCPPDGDPT